MITNPDNLTKERLKTELKKKGIRFNNNENKSYYVDLYRRKVMSQRAKEATAARSEFSDDDIRHSPRTSSRKQASTRRKSDKVDEFLPQIQKLTDSELKEELSQFGEEPGPINASTRSVYERKLAKLLLEEEGGERKIPQQHTTVNVKDDSFVGEWSDEDEEEENEDGYPEAASDRIEYQSHTSASYDLKRRPRNSSPQHVDGPAASTSNPPSVDRTPQFSQTPPRSSSPARRRNNRANSETCRILWSLLLLLCAFATVFLLYEHLTVPAGKTSILEAGYTKIHDCFAGLTAPLMARQEVEMTAEPAAVKTPPPSPSPKPKSETPAKEKPKVPAPEDTQKTKEKKPPPPKKSKPSPEKKEKALKKEKGPKKEKTPSEKQKTPPSASETQKTPPPASKTQKPDKKKASPPPP